MPERIEITKMKQNSENREYVIENVKQEMNQDAEFLEREHKI